MTGRHGSYKVEGAFTHIWVEVILPGNRLEDRLVELGGVNGGVDPANLQHHNGVVNDLGLDGLAKEGVGRGKQGGEKHAQFANSVRDEAALLLVGSSLVCRLGSLPPLWQREAAVPKELAHVALDVLRTTGGVGHYLPGIAVGLVDVVLDVGVELHELLLGAGQGSGKPLSCPGPSPSDLSLLVVLEVLLVYRVVVGPELSSAFLSERGEVVLGVGRVVVVVVHLHGSALKNTDCSPGGILAHVGPYEGVEVACQGSMIDHRFSDAIHTSMHIVPEGCLTLGPAKDPLSAIASLQDVTGGVIEDFMTRGKGEVTRVVGKDDAVLKRELLALVYLGLLVGVVVG